MVLKNGTNDATSFGRLGFGGVPPRVPIRIVNVNEPSSLTFDFDFESFGVRVIEWCLL